MLSIFRKKISIFFKIFEKFLCSFAIGLIIKDGHRAYVYDTLRRYPQEAARLIVLCDQIRNMSLIAREGRRYGNAVRVSMYLPFRVAGGFADDLGTEYDGIINKIGLNNLLNFR